MARRLRRRYGRNSDPLLGLGGGGGDLQGVAEMSLDVALHAQRETCVYDGNITHNLGRMADAAGIYQCLWRPEELKITKAWQLIAPLTIGLMVLKSDRAAFEKFNAENGWGMYEHFVPFVEKYLAACKENPDATVSASR